MPRGTESLEVGVHWFFTDFAMSCFILSPFVSPGSEF